MRPHQFQRLTIVRLCASEHPVPDTPQDDEIQAAHLNYLGSLIDRGIILVNGPVKRCDDSKFLGMSLYRTDVEEARRLASEDPGVKAGWFTPKVDEWLIPYGPVVLGDQIDLEV